VHQHVNTPWGTSNRSLLISVYHKDTREENAQYEFIVSSKGNEEQFKTLKETGIFKSDEIANTIITYWHVQPSKPEATSADNGVKVTLVGMFDPSGSIPYFAMSIISSKQAQSIDWIVECIKDR